MGGRGYEGGGGGGEGDYIPIATLSPQNDSCIKMDSEKSHFNFSIIVRDKVTNKAASTDHNF